MTQCTQPGDSAVIERHRDAVWGIQGAEHFDIQEAIASGGQGTVFRARHRETGEIVALKVFHQRGIDSQRALKDEFRSLATLHHPGIVRMYELHVAEDYAFFTMEFVEGSDLDAYLRLLLPAAEVESRGAQYWSALRLAITQLAIAIDAAHGAGLLHLDIKPGNVRVTATGRVVLLDFGLVRHARQRAGMPTRQGGTPPYMAPEQLVGSSVSEKTDWYAFGALLTQLLHGAQPAGRPPHRHSSAPVQAKPASAPPEDLVSLSHALFQYKPEARPSGREVLARLGALTPRASVNIGAASIARIVGRGPELAALEQVLDAYKRDGWRGTSVVKVSGRPGIGKTYLLRSFVDALSREQHANVFSGRCFQRAMVPYRLLDELMDHLAEARRRQHAAADSGADMQALARMFPVFAADRAAAEPAAAAPRLEEITPRAVRALVQILRAFSHDNRPLVLWLDDVQWTDLDSVPILMSLLAHNTTPLILLLSGHTFDAGRPLVRALDELSQTQEQLRVSNIELHGLSAAETAALVAELDPSQLSVKDQIWEQAHGNPLQIAELVRHGSIDELPHTSAASVPLDQLYIGRAAHLSAQSRKLLELVALSDQPLPRALLLSAAEIVGDEHAPLGELVRAAFVTASGSAVDLAHDTIRSCVRGYLSQAQRRAAHRALAAAHATHTPAAHEALAYHYEGAGELDACILHLRQGAEASAAALAFDRAATLYERAAKLNADPEAARSLELRAIELRLLSGHFEEAEPALRQLLSEVSLPTFRSEQSALVRCLFELGLMVARGLPEHPAPRVLSELQRVRLEACQAALRGYSTNATFRGAVYGVILLRLACEAGEGFRIALASVHVASVLTFSNLAWAKEYGRKLLERAKRMAQGDAELSSLVESGTGTLELFAGHWRSAYAKLSPNSLGPGFASRFGPEWILGGQMSLIALDHLGEMAQLKLDAQRILESGLQQGNRMIAGESRLWCAIADLASDRVGDARRQLALAEQMAPKNVFLFVHWLILRLRVQILLVEGDYLQALLTIRRERKALRGSGLLTIQFIRVLICQLEAIAVAGCAIASRTPELARKRALAELAGLGRKLARDTAPHARAAHAVIHACAEAVRGRTAHLLRALQRAETAFAGADMAVHAAAMRLCRHCIVEDAEDVRPEEQLMQRSGVHAPRRWVRWLAPCGVRP